MGIFRPRAKPDLSLLQGTRVYGTKEQAQSLPRLVREVTQRGGTPRDVMDAIHRYHQLTDSGFLTQEVASEIVNAFSPVPEPIGDSSSGIEPCGYGEL